jgi:rare lipoprotein A
MKYLGLLIFAGLSLSGCTELQLTEHFAKKAMHQPPPQTAPAITGPRKIGKPYEIMGQWYYPIDSSDGFREKGIASWYGKDFHGKDTANGERYNMYAYTAAHKTLPLPTYVRVTNLQNGKSLVVRVNDRGPFVAGRVIDLSYASAVAIGMHIQGTAPVLVEALPTDGSPLQPAETRWVAENKTTQQTDTNFVSARFTDSVVARAEGAEASGVTGTVAMPELVAAEEIPSPTPPQPGLVQEIDGVTVGHVQVYIQTGAFTNYDNALAQLKKVQAYFTAELQEATINGKTFHRVRIGPMVNVDEADSVLAKALENGFADARVVID